MVPVECSTSLLILSTLIQGLADRMKVHFFSVQAHLFEELTVHSQYFIVLRIRHPHG